MPRDVVRELLRAADDEFARATRWTADRHRAEQTQLLLSLAADTGARRGELDTLLLSDLQGRLLHIERGVSEEIEPCACGRKGCLEAVASGLALARSAERAVAAGRQTVLREHAGHLSVEHLAAAAETGDELAVELLTRASQLLGVAATWLLNITNPTVLVLSGGMVAAGEVLLGRCGTPSPLAPCLRSRR